MKQYIDSYSEVHRSTGTENWEIHEETRIYDRKCLWHDYMLYAIAVQKSIVDSKMAKFDHRASPGHVEIQRHGTMYEILKNAFIVKGILSYECDKLWKFLDFMMKSDVAELIQSHVTMYKIPMSPGKWRADSVRQSLSSERYWFREIF